jgi:PPOX class probable F420-dependent enzyme
MPPEPVLSAEQRAFLGAARRAVLGTIAPDGRPRLVPICFSLDPDGPALYTPIDDKPKSTDDPLGLARVRDIERDPRVSVLVDRWDEDWTQLAWLRCAGMATVEAPSPNHAGIVAILRSRYPQYAEHRLERRPLIRIEIERVTTWGPVEAGPVDPG